jgi:hypothetical protein
LEQSPAPHASPLWNASGPSFYDSKVAAYRRLRRGVERTIARVTLITAAAARATQLALAHDIARADGLDLAAMPSNALLVQQASELKAATTPGQYRAVQSSLVSTDLTLQASIGTRMRALDALIAQAHGTLPGIGTIADAEGASCSPNLICCNCSRRAQPDISRRLLVSPLSFIVKQHPDRGGQGPGTADGGGKCGSLCRAHPSEKMIVVSTEGEWAHLYQGTQLVLDTPVTTGGPELPTDHGVFHIYFKASPFVFHSPWPPDSPFYYFPTPVQFWMPFDGGEGLHDASWRSDFGPGSNLAPTDLGTGRTIQGTHGCVNLPFDAAQFIWNWAPVGTTVVVI